MRQKNHFGSIQQPVKEAVNVLIACEFSGVVRRAFRSLGHSAWSCDLLAAEDGPRHHIRGDAIEAIRKGRPTDGARWDLIIAHPPCTYLANSGVRWLYKDGARNNARWEDMRAGVRFFADLWNACGDTPRAFENPVMHCHAAMLLCELAPGIFANGRPQIIQPWQFGHPETKATGFYLHGLPRLTPTNVVYAEMMALPPKERNRVHYASPGAERWKSRSRTLEGVAAAMAAQWGGPPEIDP